jgi:virginiamycin B lyase
MKTIRLLLGAALASLALNVSANTLSGRLLTDTGEPVAGGLVTLWNSDHNRKETVYSDASGHWHLETAFAGDLVLRGRAPMYGDFNVDIVLADGESQQHTLVLVKLTDPLEISNQLTAAAHAAALPFPSQRIKDAFISQCSYCHQQGNALTRAPHTPEQWSASIWRMEGYGAYITYDEHRQIKKMLGEGFTGQPINVVETAPYSTEMARAKVREWHVGDALSFLHDTMVGLDGKLYGIDEGKDVIFILDRGSGAIVTAPMPLDGVQTGGRFRGVRLPIGVFTGSHGPHSSAQLSDGRIFITGALSGQLLMYNPADGAWKTWTIPPGFLWRKGLYPHTIRADKAENLWFTTTFSNRLVKFDPRSEQFTDVALPHDGFLRWMSDTFMGAVLKLIEFFPEKNYQLVLSHHKWLNGGREAFNWPYGIDVSPVDDSVWFSKLLGNRIGTIDRDTQQITEFETPYKGPRRLRFGPDGMLWIPSFDDGKLMRFDPNTQAFESIDLPVLADGEYEMPYALNVHPKTGDVWIAANNTDRVLRYIPAEKRFIAYPMPNRVIWFRDLDFTTDGQVCSSNSNLPAYAHEDGVPAFVCIEPEPNGAYGQ